MLPSPPSAVPAAYAVSRAYACISAERLIDVAYALAAGGKLRLDDDQEVDLPFAGQVTLERQSTFGGGRAELAIKVSWSEGS